MSQLMGGKVALELVKPNRYRVHYHILLGTKRIGEIELDHIAWRSGEAELKIDIFDPLMHNHGYGTDAIITLLEQAFLTMNLTRIYLRVQASNEKALHCYEKVGFRKEGRLQRLTESNTEEEIFLMALEKARFQNHHHLRAI
ncbi:MAG: GNAT family N-acetyltransferase [Firmicutes bacterium]|nr:GNAT family N-acetyltransferase [Bacillota bacterium]